MNKHHDISSGLHRRKGRFGFTLVELLVIVAIITLLLGMLLPSLNKFYDASEKAEVQAAINLIDGACRQYFNDFNDCYPPSNDSNYSGWRGSQLITLFLTGYGPDAGDDGIPDVANLDTNDGVAGYGYRTVKRGKVYGEWGAENLSVSRDSGRPEFVDVYGNAILYYRWGGSNYNGSHNTGDPDPNTYAKDSDGDWYRTDFILISKGQNEEWDAPKDGDVDDVTNFFNR